MSSIKPLARAGDHEFATSSESLHVLDGARSDKPRYRRVLVVISMAFLWTGSQIPLYFYGGMEQQILDALNGYDKSTWIALGYLLPLGIITPFVGALSDIFGRKTMATLAFVTLMVGNVMMACAPSIELLIAGSAVTGAGAGVGELVALAVVGEITPTRKRGLYMGAVHLAILPFAPSVMYAQFIARASSWRWCGLLIGSWCAIGLVLMLLFYWPPTWNSDFKRSELAKRIDFVGGFLSAAGLTPFLTGLVFASEGASWASAKVLAPFITGIVFMAIFVIWEAKFVKYPMFPRRLKEINGGALIAILLITFASGANFFATLIFWPTQYQAIYAEDNAVSAGIGSLPTGLGIILGGMIGNCLVVVFKKHLRWLMVGCTALMTAANGAMACGTPDNLTTLWPIVSLACIGVGLTVVPNQVIAGIVCPDDLIGTITAATITARILGGAIAYAVYYEIFGEHFRSLVPTIIAPAARAAGVGSPEQIAYIADIVQNGGGFDYLKKVPGVVNQTQVEILARAGKLAAALSYSEVYYASIAFGFVAFVASFFLTGIHKQMDDTVAVEM